MYSAPSGAGQVGVGPNTPLGNNRLGWYAESDPAKDCAVWEYERAGLPDPKQSAAIVSFYIMRDGSVRTPTIQQSSGNPTIDNTALRAVFQASPMPLFASADYTSPTITAQFTFNLR